MPGVHHQHGEVSDDPQPYHRVPWPHSELNHYEPKPPTTKDKANLSGGLKTIQRENHFSSQLSTIARKDECDGVRDPPAPLFYRHLQMALSNTLERSNQNYEALMTLPTESLDELDWWNNHMLKWNGKSLIKKEIDLTIDSDASLTGWGAHCSYQSTGGAWSCQEATMHINCLELLAAILAVKSFAKLKSRISILLRIENTTAVAYINNLGGTVSSELVQLTRSLWMWCLERNIHITAQYLPGSQNVIADAESRVATNRIDWRLNPAIFAKIDHLFGPLEVDLFATRLSTQCQRYFNWRPDPYAEATDGFLQNWSHLEGYANPPWNLIGKAISQV